MEESIMTRTENLPQIMATTQTQTQATSVKTPVTEPVLKSLTPSKTTKTSIRQRTASEARTADQPVVAAFAFFNVLRQQAKAIGVELAVYCRLDNHGILGKLFNEDARTAKALCEMRLADLKDDLKTFSGYANLISGRKDKAASMLAEMEEALADAEEQPAAFLDLLATYEKEFNKVSFMTILDARFMGIEGAEKFDLRSVTKEGTFVSVEDRMTEIMANLGRANSVEDAKATEEAVAQAALIQVTPGNDLTTETLLNVYIDNNPALVARMITSWSVNELLTVENAENRGLAQSALNMEATPEAIRNILKSNDDLNNDIMLDIANLHMGRIFKEMKDFPVATASVEELIAARQQCVTFNQLSNEFAGELSTSAIAEQKVAAQELQAAIAARMIEVYTGSEAAMPADQRLFWLGAPTAEQVKAKLSGTELMKSTEKALYENILAYMDARQAFALSGDHSCLIKMQQARFDMLRSQQTKLTEEMDAQIAGTPAATVLGNSDFHADMELLETIYQVRQTTAKYRPVNTLGENVMRLAGNIIWRDEVSLNDTKAKLVHDFQLKQLGYSFKEEFMAVCGGSQETLSQICTGIKDIASKAAKGATALTTSKIGLFQAIGLGMEAYSGIQKVLGETLKEVLEVAQRNPVAFRRMCGDFAQLVPQLKLLVGSNTELTAVIDQLSYRLAAESAASCFAGDEAVNLDEEIDPKSDLAKNLKRFQFFCDLSAGMLKGATGLNLIAGALNGPVGFARALFNVGTMVVTREAVNHMDPKAVRMLDKLFRYGPVVGWTATSPFDVAARAARNVGQNKGLVASVTNAVFAPYLKRYNALTEAIMNVQNHKPGAWAELALESAKTTAILAATLGSTCVAASTLALGTSVLATTGAALTAAWTVTTFSYGTAQLISYLEDNQILKITAQGIEMFAAQYFSGNSKMAKSIRLKCEKEAANIVAGMAKMDAYQQEIIEKAAREMYKAHWNLVAHKATHEARVESFLTQNKESRQQQAKELADKVQVLALIEEKLNQAAEISQNDEQITKLRKQLKDLGIDQRAPETGLVHFMLNLKQEITTSILRQTGTDKPGTTAEQIEAALVKHQSEVMLGSVVREQLNISDAEKVATVEAKAKAEHCKLVTESKAKIEQQRIELMYTGALKGLVEDEADLGHEFSVGELKKMDMEAVLDKRVKKQFNELKTVNAERVAKFQSELDMQPLMRDLSVATRDRVKATAKLV